MGYNIGFFKATDTGYTGTIETLTHKLKVDFHRILDRTNGKAPALEGICGELKIAAAWEYTGRNGKYFFVSFEDPSFSSGKYYLSRNRGVDDAWTLSFERPKEKKDNAETRHVA